MVDTGRIELPPLHCQCSVLPLNYRPIEMVDTCGLEPRTHPCEGCVLPNYTTGPFENGVPSPVLPRGHACCFRD